MPTKGPIVLALSEESLTERIVRASQRVCFVAPGLYDWVAEALLEVGPRIGWDRVQVFVDPDPFVVQVGYGTEMALKRVCESGAIVRKASGLRLGLVVTDDTAAVFSPMALNIEEFPKTKRCANAIDLTLREANRILDAIAPTIADRNHQESFDIGEAGCEHVAAHEGVVIGKESIQQADLQVLHDTLEQIPPVAPDLARQMWVLNSQIQIIKITFEGARLSQHRLPLKADQLGIEDPDLARRISGSFKLFEAHIDGLLAPLRNDLDSIKEVYQLKPIGELGHVVLGRDRRKLESALNMFRSNLELAQKDIEQAVADELENSRNRLRKLLESKMQVTGMSGASLDRRLNYILSSMKFPTADKVLSKIEFDWSILNITSQMIEKQSFAEKVQQLYGRSIQELATMDRAVAVRTGRE
jgi:hypothetical protein